MGTDSVMQSGHRIRDHLGGGHIMAADITQTQLVCENRLEDDFRLQEVETRQEAQERPREQRI